MQFKAVLVVGVGRDGTSMFTGIVSALGFYLGRSRDLLSPNALNPHGFYEHKMLPKLNRLILEHHEVPEYGLGRIIRSVPNHIQQRLNQFYAETYPGHKNVVLKDPRFCVTLPVWLSIVRLYHQPLLLVVSRSYERHYNSLRKALRLAIGDPERLHEYIANRSDMIDSHKKEFGAICVHYDSFIQASDRAVLIQRLSEDLGGPIGLKPQEYEDIARRHIRRPTPPHIYDKRL